jgi:hypothetical protein
MRSYAEIMNDLKMGKKPPYEEVRLAAIMADDLLFFANNDVKNLCEEKKVKIFTKEWFLQENQNRNYRAFQKSPEEWLGNDHPDNPDYQKRVAIESKILNKILKDIEFNTKQEERL